ncbi:MAG: toll/interleukin-1 receptor domain-containing protein [Desulfobacterales bacterium]
MNGGIHYHYYQPQSPPAATPEKPKDSGNNIQCKPLKVFISYAREDIATARRLYEDLKMAGIVPWMDKIDLLPGQNWKFHITKAIRESSYFIALLSSKSLSKRGFVQKELKLALDILGEFSDEDVFLIPARLDDCQPEDEKLKYLNWADLFPSYEASSRDDILRVFPVCCIGKN